MSAIGGANVIPCYEGERLPSEINTARNRACILRATQHLPAAFRPVLGGQSLQIGNIVGFIDLGDVRLEILPKASGVAGEEGDAGQFLLDLLSIPGVVPRLRPAAGDVHATASLLEGLVRAFADDLAERLSQGVPRRYSEVAENSPVVRGRIDFCRMALRPPGNDHILPIRHAPLQFDNPLSQVILATVNRLLRVVRSVRTAAILQHCAALLDRVSRVSLTPERVRRLQLTPFESAWKPVVDFAAALASGYFPDPVSGGAIRSFSLTFSLDDLYEAVLRKLRPTVLAGSGLALATTRPRSPLLRSLDTGAEVLALKPDYLFLGAVPPAQKRLVGDAKWKRLKGESPSLGLDSSDVYQLTTYMAYHGLDRGVLLFPADRWMAHGESAWSRRFALIDPAGGKRITVVGVDLAHLISQDPGLRATAQERLRRALCSCL
jgi:5-methylcytosine-specific restriction enzyme subunit McrC